MSNIHKHEWSAPVRADISKGVKYNRMRACGYCGSMHPTDVVNAINNGAKGSFADFKYGWPHKIYFDHVPNPNAGAREIISTSTHEREGLEKVVSPRYSETTGERVADHVEYVGYRDAPALTHGKFYTEHLQDATPEEVAIIEQHMGVHFIFADGGVKWMRLPVRQVPSEGSPNVQ